MAESGISTKCCARCGTEKSTEEFCRQPLSRDGLHSWCRRCNADSCRAYRRANPDKSKTTVKVYRDAHSDKAKVTSAQWRLDNPDRAKANRDAWATAHSDRLKEADTAWRLANKEHLAAKKAAWRSTNKEHAASNDRNRRARLRGAEGRHTSAEIKTLAIQQKYRCANPTCRRSIKNKWHVDHIMPLILGGTNWIRNIQLLCPFCNISKHAKHPIIWARKNGLLL